MANSSKELPHGIQTRLALKAGIAPQLVNGYLHGRKNASGPVADKLSAITKSDIRIWLLGGDSQERLNAVRCWGMKTRNKTGLSSILTR